MKVYNTFQDRPAIGTSSSGSTFGGTSNSDAVSYTSTPYTQNTSEEDAGDSSFSTIQGVSDTVTVTLSLQSNSTGFSTIQSHSAKTSIGTSSSLTSSGVFTNFLSYSSSTNDDTTATYSTTEEQESTYESTYEEEGETFTETLTETITATVTETDTTFGNESSYFFRTRIVQATLNYSESYTASTSADGDGSTTFESRRTAFTISSFSFGIATDGFPNNTYSWGFARPGIGGSVLTWVEDDSFGSQTTETRASVSTLFSNSASGTTRTWASGGVTYTGTTTITSQVSTSTSLVTHTYRKAATFTTSKSYVDSTVNLGVTTTTTISTQYTSVSSTSTTTATSIQGIISTANTTVTITAGRYSGAGGGLASIVVNLTHFESGLRFNTQGSITTNANERGFLFTRSGFNNPLSDLASEVTTYADSIASTTASPATISAPFQATTLTVHTVFRTLTTVHSFSTSLTESTRTFTTYSIWPFSTTSTITTSVPIFVQTTKWQAINTIGTTTVSKASTLFPATVPTVITSTRAFVITYSSEFHFPKGLPSGTYLGVSTSTNVSYTTTTFSTTTTTAVIISTYSTSGETISTANFFFNSSVSGTVSTSTTTTINTQTITDLTITDSSATTTASFTQTYATTNSVSTAIDLCSITTVTTTATGTASQSTTTNSTHTCQTASTSTSQAATSTTTLTTSTRSSTATITETTQTTTSASTTRTTGTSSTDSTGVSFTNGKTTRTSSSHTRASTATGSVITQGGSYCSVGTVIGRIAPAVNQGFRNPETLNQAQPYYVSANFTVPQNIADPIYTTYTSSTSTTTASTAASESTSYSSTSIHSCAIGNPTPVNFHFPWMSLHQSRSVQVFGTYPSSTKSTYARTHSGIAITATTIFSFSSRSITVTRSGPAIFVTGANTFTSSEKSWSSSFTAEWSLANSRTDSTHLIGYGDFVLIDAIAGWVDNGRDMIVGPFPVDVELYAIDHLHVADSGVTSGAGLFVNSTRLYHNIDITMGTVIATITRGMTVRLRCVGMECRYDSGSFQARGLRARIGVRAVGVETVETSNTTAQASSIVGGFPYISNQQETAFVHEENSYEETRYTDSSGAPTTTRVSSTGSVKTVDNSAIVAVEGVSMAAARDNTHTPGRHMTVKYYQY